MDTRTKSEIDHEARMLLLNLNNNDDYDSDFDTDDIETAQHDGYAIIYIWKTSAKGHLKRIGHVSMTLYDVNDQELTHISAWPDPETNTIQYLKSYAADCNAEDSHANYKFMFKKLNTGKMLEHFNTLKGKLAWRFHGSGFWRKSNETVNCVGIVLQLLRIGNVGNLFDFKIYGQNSEYQATENITGSEECLNFLRIFAEKNEQPSKDELYYEKAKDVWRIGDVGFNQKSDKLRLCTANLAGIFVCLPITGVTLFFIGFLFYAAIVGEENVHGVWRRMLFYMNISGNKTVQQAMNWISAFLGLIIGGIILRATAKKIFHKTIGATPHDVAFLLAYISEKAADKVQLIGGIVNGNVIDRSLIEDEVEIGQPTDSSLEQQMVSETINTESKTVIHLYNG